MRVLVFGQTGQVARELARRCPAGVTARLLGRNQADLMDPADCAAAIADYDVVINAAAWTALDKAETEETTATVVNGAAPTAMAARCAALGLPFLHISTDYVFDGTGEAPFTTNHPTAPLGAYGRSKLAGEQGVLAVVGRSFWRAFAMLHWRTQIARFLLGSYKTLQVEARKTTVFHHEIIRIGVVQGEPNNVYSQETIASTILRLLRPSSAA